MIRFAFILLVFFNTLSRAEGICCSSSQEAFASINRNVTDTEEELHGWDIKPLHIALPINSIRQIMMRAGWIKDDPVIEDEKDWKDKFKEDSWQARCVFYRSKTCVKIRRSVSDHHVFCRGYKC